jgi:hypothetical protein
MAPSAPFTTTRPSRVLHWLFPSRRVVLAAVAVELAAFLLGLPLPLHIGVALAAHIGLAVVRLAPR